MSAQINSCNFKRKFSFKIHTLLILFSMLMTIIFTLMDNIITPLFYGFSSEATKAYLVASIFAMIPQVICVLFTTTILFRPLYSIIIRFNH